MGFDEGGSGCDWLHRNQIGSMKGCLMYVTVNGKHEVVGYIERVLYKMSTSLENTAFAGDVGHWQICLYVVSGDGACSLVPFPCAGSSFHLSQGSSILGCADV